MSGWNALNTSEDLNDALNASEKGPVMLLKHSTRCSISSMALNRVEQSLDELSKVASCYLIDLIAYRDISNRIASVLDIKHESPQVLVLKNRVCIYTSSHYDIRPSTILKSIE
jgi:bacillithiol system protein YtxJ